MFKNDFYPKSTFITASKTAQDCDGTMKMAEDLTFALGGSRCGQAWIACFPAHDESEYQGDKR